MGPGAPHWGGTSAETALRGALVLLEFFFVSGALGLRRGRNGRSHGQTEGRFGLRFARAAKRARVNAPIVAGDAPVDGDVAGASDARPKSPRADVDCELVGEIVTASSGEKFVVAE
eukprot:jgi/Mesvir1/3399/Mv02564-RA.1